MKKAVTLTEKDTGKYSADTFRVCMKLAECCEENGDAETAQKYRLKAADVRERLRHQEA